MLKIKRAYEGKSTADGQRIYIDRLWPRGMSKEEFKFDEWMKELSPSDDLRKWFGHEPDKFQEFKKRYVKELADPSKQALLKRLTRMAYEGDVTLVYSARDTEHNDAVVLVEIISKLMKGKVVV
jgi:uncharacterized protein YeaO (DUF488 family)